MVFFFLLVQSGNIIISNSLKADRWLEIDLYRFERNDMEKCVNQFWNKYNPLLADVDGWNGLGFFKQNQ